MGRPTGKPTKTIPLRVDDEFLALVKEASAIMHWPDVDVMRLAMKIGLEKLKRINYDVAGVICDQTENEEKGAHLGKIHPLPLAAEEPGKWKTKDGK